MILDRELCFLNRAELKGDMLLIPEFILDANSRTHYSKLTMDELRGLRDAVKNIEHIGKFSASQIRDGFRINTELLVEEMAREMEKYYHVQGASAMNPATPKKGQILKIKEGTANYLGGLETVEMLTIEIDGHKDLGAAHKNIFLEVRNAEVQETATLNEVLKRFSDGVTKIYGTPTPGELNQKIELDITKRDVNGIVRPDLGNWEMTRENIIMAVVHMGNASQQQAAVHGWMVLEGSATLKFCSTRSPRRTRRWCSSSGILTSLCVRWCRRPPR